MSDSWQEAGKSKQGDKEELVKCISVHRCSFHSYRGKVSLLGGYVGLGAQSVTEYLLLTCEQTCSIQNQRHQAAVAVIWPGALLDSYVSSLQKGHKDAVYNSSGQLSWLSGTYHGCGTINKSGFKNKPSKQS